MEDQNEKNYIWRVVVMVLGVLAVLLALYYVPAINVGGHTLRRVDLLADARPDSAAVTAASLTQGESDSVARLRAMSESLPVIEGSRLTRDALGREVPVEDSVLTAMAMLQASREGVTPIVDMSGDQGGGMASFYEALSQAKSRPVRIAVVGDSYIEGDIMTSMLRDLLQERFGGRGPGYLPVTDLAAGIRRTVSHKFGGWLAHKAVDRSGYIDTYNNLTGYYFTATTGAWMSLGGSGREFARNASCTSSSLYFMPAGSYASVTALVNDSVSRTFALGGTAIVDRVTVSGDIKSVKWTVNSPTGVVFLGASMDSGRGVAVDNLGMRSARGKHLKSIPAANLQALQRARGYDLIIIMYGLNIDMGGNGSYAGYRRMMDAALANLKENLPGTSLLMVSCGDRASRGSDGFRTAPAVLKIIQAQKRIAINNRIAFWDLYSAMGGEGSVAQMVTRGEASHDYTHLTTRGGYRIARLLYDALMLGYDNSDQKKTTAQ